MADDKNFIRIDDTEAARISYQIASKPSSKSAAGDQSHATPPMPEKLDHLPSAGDKSMTAKLADKVRLQASKIVMLERDKAKADGLIARLTNELNEEKDKNEQLMGKVDAANQVVMNKLHSVGSNSQDISSIERVDKDTYVQLESVKQDNILLKKQIQEYSLKQMNSQNTELELIKEKVKELTSINNQLVNFRAASDSTVLDLMRENDTLQTEVAPSLTPS